MHDEVCPPRGARSPLVSVVIPVYNTVDWIRETVDSARPAVQGLAESDVEIIVVDDGSTDGTAELLREIAGAGTGPGLRVIHRANSGGPSAPRNMGLEAAAGRYVFFLDADDTLAEGTLRDLVAAAEAGPADVVIGRTEGTGGRRVGSRPYRASVPDADVVDDHVWDTLSPGKLFRRELIERLGLRFPEDQWIGEDQIFVGTALLSARRITVLADRVYYHQRLRETGNLTRRDQTLADKAKTSVRLAEVIGRFEHDPDRRAEMMKRIFLATLSGAFGAPLRAADDEELRAFVDAMAAGVAPHYVPAIEDAAGDLDRIRFHLLFTGQSRALREFCAGASAVRVGIDGGTAHYVLPEGIDAQVPERLTRLRRPPALRQSLLALDAVGPAFRIRGRAAYALSADPPAEVSLTAVNRGDGRRVPLPTTPGDAASEGDSAFREFTAEFDAAALAGAASGAADGGHGGGEALFVSGPWDVELEVAQGGLTSAARFGHDAAAGLDRAPRRLEAALPVSHPTVTAYFTKYKKDLTFHVGDTGQNPLRELVTEVRIDGDRRLHVLLAGPGIPARDAVVRLAGAGPAKISCTLAAPAGWNGPGEARIYVADRPMSRWARRSRLRLIVAEAASTRELPLPRP